MRVPVLGTAAALFALSMAAVNRLGVELIPPLAQGEFSFELELPEGTSIEATDRLLADLADGASRVPGVAAVHSTAGGSGSGADPGSRSENVGEVLVQMGDRSNKALEEDAIRAIRALLDRQPALTSTFSRPSYFTFKTPIEVELYGDDYAALEGVAARIADRLREVPGLADVASSAEAGSPEIRIRFDPDQLARLGLTPEAVSQTLRAKVKGEVATRLSRGDRDIDVVVRASELARDEASDVVSLIVQRRDGVAIPLRSVAQTQVDVGPSEIRRVGQRRAVVLSGNLQGRDLGSVTRDIERVVADMGPPPSMTARMGGQNLEMATSFKEAWSGPEIGTPVDTANSKDTRTGAVGLPSASLILTRHDPDSTSATC